MKKKDCRRSVPPINWLQLAIWTAIALFIASWLGWRPGDEATTISYTAFRQHLKEGNVDHITIQVEKLTALFKGRLPLWQERGYEDSRI